MLKVALRGLLAHKGRLLATLLAVALGVAFIAGVLVLTDTMNRSFDDIFATAYEGTDAVVRSDQTVDTGFGGGEVRGDIDAALLATVEAVPSVAAAAGDVQGSVLLLDEQGDDLGSGGFGPPTFGGNWPDVAALNSWRLRQGEPPTAAGQVVVDAGTADDHNFSVGDTLKVQTKQGVGDFTLVGIAGFGTANSLGGASYVLFTTDEAQELVGLPGKFSSISVAAQDGVFQDELVRNLRPAVGDGIEVISGEKITEEAQSDLKGQLSFITTALLIFAGIAVVVGSFVIYNSFAIVIAQRVREMALLRAIGASRTQVRRSVLVEAVAVGLVGSVVGFLLGLGIASLLVTLLDIEGSILVTPMAVLVSILVGLVVTLVVALFPARRASRVPPVAAMRAVAIDTSAQSTGRFVVGLVLAALGVVGVVIGAGQREALNVGLGMMALFVGLIVAGPGLARPVSALVGWPLGKLRGITGSLARKNAGRNPKRSAVTAYALMIGIGIVSLILVVNASFRASIDKILDESFSVDYVISAGSFGEIGMPPDVAQTVAALPEVRTVVPIRQTPATVDGDDTGVTGTSPEAFELFGFDVVEGADTLDVGQVVVLDDTAREHNLSVGSTVDGQFLNSGPATLTVAGIYKGTEANDLGDWVVGLDQYDQLVPGSTDSQLLVKLVTGVSVDDAKPTLERAVEPFGTAKVQTANDVKEEIKSALTMLLNIFLALLAMAFLIAVLGIANTIALSVLERTRELGLLRAVGMTRRQLRAAIRWESVIIALFGVALGLAFGLLGGWGFVSALRDDGVEVFRVPYGPLIVLALVAALLGLGAALVPAWRAGRLKVLEAIHTE